MCTLNCARLLRRGYDVALRIATVIENCVSLLFWENQFDDAWWKKYKRLVIDRYLRKTRECWEWKWRFLETLDFFFHSYFYAALSAPILFVVEKCFYAGPHYSRFTFTVAFILQLRADPVKNFFNLRTPYCVQVKMKRSIKTRVLETKSGMAGHGRGARLQDTTKYLLMARLSRLDYETLNASHVGGEASNRHNRQCVSGRATLVDLYDISTS